MCIYGLGAVGGFIGARLAASGARVSAIARGRTLEAVARDGLRLIEPAAQRGGDPGAATGTTVPLHAVQDPAQLGPQDLVVVSVKTTGLGDVARRIGPLLGRDTVVLSAMNGVPWWFFHGLDGGLASREWTSIDPGRAIDAAIPVGHVLGCVVHFACSAPAPGVVRHVQGKRLIVGEPAGGDSDRCRSVAALLAGAGFQTEVSQRIQQDIWFKLWGNMTMNPVSAITGATADRILDDPLVRAFVSCAMVEASAIGERIGLPIPITPEQRHQVTRQLGAFKTSMLQDVEAGRPVELDALVAIVAEIGRALGVPTPNVDALFGLARLHARTRGLYPG
ncbi:MAG: 2-dehydropantoate 2-reductase [Burkholderiales bacterium]|nr:MAG: 2-dehydropantoate 2-reductase [Burkholderiales bacterium]